MNPTNASREGSTLRAEAANDVRTIQRIAAVDSILEIVCKTTGMGFAAVARVTTDQWTACAVRDEIGFGLAPGGELPLETTLCHEVRQARSAIVIEDVPNDPLYCGHHTPSRYGFRSYVSLPIVRRNGDFFGTLCALDAKPAHLVDPKIIGLFEAFATLIGHQLEMQEHLEQSEAHLLDVRQTAELREQFIAVIGHDLRNPISAIANSATIVGQTELTEKARRYLGYIQDSAQRMGAMVDNLLDFARGRLGGGFALDMRPHTDLGERLHSLMAEALASHPGRQVRTAIDLRQPVVCDALRIGQIFSNLLGNALRHGAADKPVEILAESQGDVFTLAVSNGGAPLPETVASQLFRPFSRKTGAQKGEGLGLGLFIASELAKAHGGTLSVASGERTTFTLRMPATA